MSRIHEIVTLPPENDKAQSAEVPAEWPSQGEIVFDNVKLQYKYVFLKDSPLQTDCLYVGLICLMRFAEYLSKHDPAAKSVSVVVLGKLINLFAMSTIVLMFNIVQIWKE